jgi:hypothetical protein
VRDVVTERRSASDDARFAMALDCSLTQAGELRAGE